MTLIPVAIGVAILRYRLYEIDRLVSRTIGWGVVTGRSGRGVRRRRRRALESILAPITTENTLAVAGSTLAAAALFQPHPPAGAAGRRPPVRSGELRRATHR